MEKIPIRDLPAETAAALSSVEREQEGWVVALDGWVLDSGQHPPIAPRDRILSAVEICTFAIVYGVECPIETAEPPNGSPVAVTARIIEITPGGAKEVAACAQIVEPRCGSRSLFRA